VSVTGEFHRLVRYCTAYLDEHEHALRDVSRARDWQQTVDAAAALADDSLPAAANATLDLLDQAGRCPTFEPSENAAEFVELVDHLASICRVIVGRSAHEPTTLGSRD